jgi:hypothetical protein
LRRSKLHSSVSVLAALVAGTGATLVTGDAASAAGRTVTAGEDTYTSSGRRASTFGAEDKLNVGRQGTDSRVAYLKFTVPAGIAVTGARLTLTPIGRVAGRFALNRVLSDAWTEGALSSSAAPALGLAVASAAPRATAAAVSFDLGAEITGPGTYSFALHSSATAAVTRFRSSENRSGRPTLTMTGGVSTAPAPTTPAPAPAAPAPSSPTPGTPAPTGDCRTGALLVPTCGVLWGAAAGGFTELPGDTELKSWERLSGRTATIFHAYHKADEPFPLKSEIAMTNDPAHPRVLLLNWKIAHHSTWARVASGQHDRRIDAFAARAKAFGKKFFLVLNHEPENDVITRAGSGMTAKDFAAMYRHTILRLRAKGVTNVVNVVAYMGNEKWMSQSWWKDLYPGDDVVDWMGLDSYVNAKQDDYHYGVFADLLDRRGTTGPGFYEWATTRHAGKPMMVVEWGSYHRVGHVADKAPTFNSVIPELTKRPAIKAVVYFDTHRDDEGDRDISINSTARNLAAFRTLAANPMFDVAVS